MRSNDMNSKWQLGLIALLSLLILGFESFESPAFASSNDAVAQDQDNGAATDQDNAELTRPHCRPRGPRHCRHRGPYPPPRHCRSRNTPTENFRACCSGTVIYWQTGNPNVCYWDGVNGSGETAFDPNQVGATPCILPAPDYGISANIWVCR